MIFSIPEFFPFENTIDFEQNPNREKFHLRKQIHGNNQFCLLVKKFLQKTSFHSFNSVHTTCLKLFQKFKQEFFFLYKNGITSCENKIGFLSGGQNA